MKKNYSIQIQQEIHEIDRYKRDIDIINMQISSILNRIMMSTRPLNIPRHEPDNAQKIGSFRPNVRSNDSFLPQLNSNRQPIINSSRVAFSAMPLSNNIESNEIRHPVSEPRMNSKMHAFYRYNRNLNPISSNSSNEVISSDDSADDNDDYYDTNNSYTEIANDNIINNVTNNYSDSKISTGTSSSNGLNITDKISYNSDRKKAFNNSDLDFTENSYNNNNYNSSSSANSASNIKFDASSNDNIKSDKKVTKIYLNQNQEMKKTDQNVTEPQAALNETDDYMNEIDDIISDNFEDQNSSNDEN